MTDSVSHLIGDIAAARGLHLRVPVEVATEMLLSTWISASETALMRREDAAHSRGLLAERLAQIVRLILE